MFKGKKFLILQALFLILFLKSSMVSSKKSVRIINGLGLYQTLTAQCKSKDDDLGVHEIINGQDFEWTFKSNIWGTTKYFCNMSWKDKKLGFDAYDYKRDKKYCGDCAWLFLPKGACS